MLTVIPLILRVFVVDNVVVRGGYATIRKVLFEEVPTILAYWKFVI